MTCKVCGCKIKCDKCVCKECLDDININVMSDSDNKEKVKELERLDNV
jgi:hypothetical protein